MAFIDVDLVKYGSETVDTAFTPLLEPNLWAAKIFQDGITFTSKYEVTEAGQIAVRKLGNPASANTSQSLDFTHTSTADSLIPINFDVHIRRSEKIYELVEQARVSGKGAQKMDMVVESAGEEFQETAIQKLAEQATAGSVTTVIDGSIYTIKKAIIDARKELRENKARPDVLICSTDSYALLLELSGKEYIPNANEDVLRTGFLGRIYNMNVFENEFLGDLEDTGGTGVDESIDFVMYDHDAYSVLSRLIGLRLMPAIDFVGSYAQYHSTHAFKVSNADRVLKKLSVGSGT